MTFDPDISGFTPFLTLGIDSTKVGFFFNVFAVPGPEFITFSVNVGIKE